MNLSALRLRAASPSLLLLLLVALLSSCQTASPEMVWSDDGRQLEDLRALRVRNRPSVELQPGVVLYADSITFTPGTKRAGSAEGRVYLEVMPEARYRWMVENGYAGSATFDLASRVVTLSRRPMLERERMTMVASAGYTTMSVYWAGPMAHVHVQGPTRTDFAKSLEPQRQPASRDAFAQRVTVPPAVAEVR